LTANFLDALASSRFFSTRSFLKPPLVACAFAYTFL